MEPLECRFLLSGLAAGDYDSVAPAWFQVNEAPGAVPAGGPAQATAFGPPAAPVAAGEGWIVRLAPEAVRSVTSLSSVAESLDSGDVRFEVVRGLGLPGQLLVRSEATDADVERALLDNPHVARFARDGIVRGQLTPNDPEFAASRMIGLRNDGQFGGTAGADISATEAWDRETGSSRVVVGVIDSGIDPTHPDLYLNVWLNQGEIPTGMRAVVRPADDDGLVTLYDLNDPANAAYVTDFNGNQVIDAEDLLVDPRWSDGEDTDGNGMVDDFFGWNFLTEESFAPNYPGDALGHGTHVAGTIGAIGDNAVGVTGVAWRASLMSLKFLDQNNRGLTSHAIAAINYATMMRDGFDVDVRVLNASWGQTGGFDVNLRDAIEAAGGSDILLVAAAGNGNVLGRGIDLDATPFYPAAYDLENVVAVAASDDRDRLADFSNFGRESVDLAAPGVGILSTRAGGGYVTASGTSMAAPHVAGAAALIQSRMPLATASEIRDALLSGARSLPELTGRLSTGGRLDAWRALTANTFAPNVERPLDISRIEQMNADPHPIAVTFFDPQRVAIESLDDRDIFVARADNQESTWPVSLIDVTVADGGRRVAATYEFSPPRGRWDPRDNGIYQVWLNAEEVWDEEEVASSEQLIGAFEVDISLDGFLHVTSTLNTSDVVPGDGVVADENGNATLRAAIQEANASANPVTIILDPGTYHVDDPSTPNGGLPPITGNVTMLGFGADVSTIAGAYGVTDILLVRPNADLVLKDLSVKDARRGIVDEGGTVMLDSVEISSTWVTALLVVDGGAAYVNKSTFFSSNFGISVSASDFHMANSTLSDIAFTAFSAHGDLDRDSVFEIHYSTITRNRTGVSAECSPCLVANSILAGNDNDLALNGSRFTHDYSTFSAGGNLFGQLPEDETSSFELRPDDHVEDQAGSFLGELGNHGGRTRTVPLLTGSSAIDAAVFDPLFDTDQRGVVRPQFGGIDVAPDIGAFEALGAVVEGLVFVDQNENRTRDSGEPGISGVPVYVDLNGNRRRDRQEPTTNTVVDDPATQTMNETGTYRLPVPEIGTFSVYPVFDASYRMTVAANSGVARVSVGAAGREGDGDSQWATMSGDGRYVAFSSLSTNLTVPPTDGQLHIFVHDRQAEATQRITLSVDGAPLDGPSNRPSISADGRFIAFESDATNLIENDTNGVRDVFLHDRKTGTTTRVNLGKEREQVTGGDSYQPSISADGEFVVFTSEATTLVGIRDDSQVFRHQRSTGQTLPVSHVDGEGFGNGNSDQPAVSQDGRFVVFLSEADDLYDPDKNEARDVFVRDMAPGGGIERVSVSSDGEEADGRSATPSISGDGRFVAFTSFATNLDSEQDDTNHENMLSAGQDVFVHDRQTGETVRINKSNDGQEANLDSTSARISSDGRYVAFDSWATNLLPDSRPEQLDVFGYDRRLGRVERLSLAPEGRLSDGFNAVTSLGADGRYVLFGSLATNLIADDTNGAIDFYVNTTSLARENVPHDMSPVSGRIVLDFGLQPFPGTVLGRHVDDANRNGIVDPWEEGIEGTTLYLDLDRNGRRDAAEPFARTDQFGQYRFDNLASLRTYTVAIELPEDHVLTYPSTSEQGRWTVFVDAGSLVADRDFGGYFDQTGGQSDNASVGGRLFQDLDGDGRYDPGEPGVADQVVFLDLNDDGTRQFDEPRQLTRHDDPLTPEDETGTYSFGGLGDRSYTIRRLDQSSAEQTSPVGNAFDEVSQSLGDFLTLQTSAQAVVVGDFSGDGLDDVAVAHKDQVSVLVAGPGGFGDPVVIDLAPEGIGPIDMAVGRFNAGDQLDLIVVNHLNLTVTVLLDFDGDGFADRRTVQVGYLPRSVATGDIDGDGDMDAVVANEAFGNLSILRNDGQGRFAPDAIAVAVGNAPFAVAMGRFDDGPSLDLAVTNLGLQPHGPDFGNVTVLLNDGTGNYPNRKELDAGIAPRDIAVADFDQDGRQDLAVANFLSNDVTVLLGQGGPTADFTTWQTLSAGVGPASLDVGDIDDDGDLDLFAANYTSTELSVFRNKFDQPAGGFESAENLGVVVFRAEAVLALATGQLDDDPLLDLVVTDAAENAVSFLHNRFVAGAHRVALTGVEQLTGLDFALRPLNRPPTFDGFNSPITIDEDSDPYTLVVTGIHDGDDGAQSLRITVTSDRVDLIPDPVVDYDVFSGSASIRFQPVADRFGPARLTIEIADDGLDAIAGNADDAITMHTFDVFVRSVNDPPTAVDDFFTVPLNASRFPLDVLANDRIEPDQGETLTAHHVSQPTSGTVSTAADGLSLLYTPNAGFSGTDSFNYLAIDSFGTISGATVHLTIDGPPTVVAYSVNSGLVDSPDLPSGPAPTDWARQRSTLATIQVEFSEPVVISPGDLLLVNHGLDAPRDDDAAIELHPSQWNIDDRMLTIDLSQAPLTDGVYSLTVRETVTDLGGRPLDGDGDSIEGDAYVIPATRAGGLHRLAADFNGDGGISIFDFSTIAYWFGQSTTRAPKFVDLNDDDGISIFDFTVFASQFGVGVAFETAVAASASFPNDPSHSPDRTRPRSTPDGRSLPPAFPPGAPAAVRRGWEAEFLSRDPRQSRNRAETRDYENRVDLFADIGRAASSMLGPDDAKPLFGRDHGSARIGESDEDNTLEEALEMILGRTFPVRPESVQDSEAR